MTQSARHSSISTVWKSATTDHVADTNHVINWSETKVIDNETDYYKRWIKEAVHIRKRRGATMNRDEGQYHLTHVYDEHLLPKDKKINWQHQNALKRRWQ